VVARPACGGAVVRMDEEGDSDSETGRMSIKVAAPAGILAKLAPKCQMEGGFKRGLTGVVYGIGEDRIEIVAEGKRLDKFIEWVESFLAEECEGIESACDLATVAAKGLKDRKAMYSKDFPVVNFNPTERREVVIVLEGERLVLDYTLRHTKIEAEFNRKLTYTSRYIDDEHLELKLFGPARQLKSFVRWARRGPPLQKPTRVTMHWVEEPSLEEAQTMSTAFRDEGIMG